MILMILFLLLGYFSASAFDEMGEVGLKQHIAILQQQMDGNPVDGSILSRKYNNMLRTKDDIRDPIKVSNFIHVVSAYGSIIGSAIQSVVTTHGEGPSFQTNLDSYLTERFNRLDPSLQGLGKDMKNQFQDIRDSLQQIVEQKIDLSSYFAETSPHTTTEHWEKYKTIAVAYRIKSSQMDQVLKRGEISIVREVACPRFYKDDYLHFDFFTAYAIKTKHEINFNLYLDELMAQSLLLHLSKAFCHVLVDSYSDGTMALVYESSNQIWKLNRYTNLISHWTLTSLHVLPIYGDSFSQESTLTVSLNGGKDQLKYPLDWTGQALTSFVGELELDTRDFVLQFKNDEYSIGHAFNWTSHFIYEFENAVVNPNPSFFKEISIRHICLRRWRYAPRQTYNSCVYGDGAIHMIFKTQNSKHCYDTMNYILNHQEVKDFASQYTFSYTYNKDADWLKAVDCGIRFTTKEQLDVYFQPPEGECHEQKGHPEGKYKDKDRFMATLFSHKVKEPQQFDAVYHMPAPVPTPAFTAVPRPGSDAAASLTFITRLLIISSIMMLRLLN